MANIVAYIFSILAILTIAICLKRDFFLGLNRKEFYINKSWILMFSSYVVYMSAWCEYNSLISMFIIFTFVSYHSLVKVPKSITQDYLKWYLIFVLWCVVSYSYSKNYFYGLMMLIKLLLPFLYYFIAYDAFRSKLSIDVFVDKVVKLAPVYLGVSIVSNYILFAKFYPYFGMTLFTFTFVKYIQTRKFRYLTYCLMCLSGNIVEVKRTPLLGMIGAMAIYYFFKYRLKAILPIILLCMTSVVAILYVPALRERIFFSGTVVSLNSLASTDITKNINTNGRETMWTMVDEKFYQPNKLTGAGLGTVKGWMVSDDNPIRDSFQRLHNDWLHLKCDAGLIGVGLLVLMFISLYINTFNTYRRTRDERLKNLSLMCAMGSTSAIIHMYFENCIGVFSFYTPFILSAMYFRYIGFCNLGNSKNIPSIL